MRQGHGPCWPLACGTRLMWRGEVWTVEGVRYGERTDPDPWLRVVNARGVADLIGVDTYTHGGATRIDA